LQHAFAKTSENPKLLSTDKSFLTQEITT